ncbi:IclR family transcriptional regulator domain-containing protein [Nonomuraea composti]|uniref:IclR family transcriptional regulator domain-containing protein n=1 Tax=Nonomuraea composti TaxID=2720023 RepID=UPI001F108EEB|nr:IclR family transcriptional regulator C-terminal domain-containing protein [Nonomuraea sp. FMUSA5-5]
MDRCADSVLAYGHAFQQRGCAHSTPKGFTAGPALWRWAHLARTCAASASPGRRARSRCATWCGSATSDGYAVSHGEREPGLSAVAVLVHGGGPAGAAALTLSGPTVRFGQDRVREFAADLREAAERMSRRGFDHPLN